MEDKESYTPREVLGFMRAYHHLAAALPPEASVGIGHSRAEHLRKYFDEYKSTVPANIRSLTLFEKMLESLIVSMEAKVASNSRNDQKPFLGSADSTATDSN